jgi:DNA mismatch endonuclease (patch repair protein)
MISQSLKDKNAQRSHNMSRIRSQDTSIEIMLRKALWNKGIRYRKNFKMLPGKPDIVITKYKIAIFCDGELWHGKDWGVKRGRFKTNSDFWVSKIEKNIERDHEIDNKLLKQGWIVFHFWGKEIKKTLSACVWEILETIIDIQANNDRDLFDLGINTNFD